MRALLEVLKGLAGIDDTLVFDDYALRAVRTLVPCDIASLNIVDAVSHQATAIVDPPRAEYAGSIDLFAQFAHQNPLVAHYIRTGEESAIKFSDFVSFSELQRLDLYQVLYRPLGVRYQMSVVLSGAPLVAIAISRTGSPDFSESEREIMDVLRPHLAAAYHRAVRFGSLARAVEFNGRAVMLVSEHQRVVFATPAAERHVDTYFGPSDAPGALPQYLAEWIALQLRGGERLVGLPAVCRPLEAHRPGRSLQVHYLPTGPFRRYGVLLLEEHVTEIDLATLAALGLTYRQQEVLRWAAMGESDAEIAQRLVVSVRTVESHLAHTYTKLHCSGRQAAIARCLEVQRFRAADGSAAHSPVQGADSLP